MCVGGWRGGGWVEEWGLNNFTKKKHSFGLAWRHLTRKMLPKLPDKSLRSFGPVVGQTMAVKIKCRFHRSVSCFYYFA